MPMGFYLDCHRDFDKADMLILALEAIEIPEPVPGFVAEIAKEATCLVCVVEHDTHDATWAWWEQRRHTIGDAMFGEPLPIERPKGGVLALHAAGHSAEHDHRHPEETCEWIGGPCWSEVISYLRGDALMPKLIAGGDDLVWVELRTLYDRHLAETGA